MAMGIIKINRILFEVVLFFSSFCYIRFFNIGTDSDLQLYYFIGSFITVVYVSYKKINLEIVQLFFILFIGMIVNLFIDKNNLSSFFRGAYGYTTFLCVFYSFYYFYKKIDIKIIEKRLKEYYFIWIMVGIVQLFNNSYLTFWRYRLVIKGGRGSVSLAPEPAYFAITLILYSLVLYSINIRNKKYFIYSFLSIGLLAKSFVGLFYIITILFLVYFNKKNIKKIFLIAILLVLSLVMIKLFSANFLRYRIIYLLNLFLENPKILILKDGSSKIRVISLLFSLKGAITNFFIPNGFSTWTRYVTEQTILYSEFLKIEKERVEYYRELLLKIKYFPMNKINTMLGGVLYELGIIGILFFYRLCKNCPKLIVIIIILLSLDGLNITNPLFGILVAINYKKEKLRNK